MHIDSATLDDGSCEETDESYSSTVNEILQQPA